MDHIDTQQSISKEVTLAKLKRRAAKLEKMTKLVQLGRLDSLVEELEHTHGSVWYMSTFIDSTVHLMTSNGVSKTYESGVVGEKLAALHG